MLGLKLKRACVKRSQALLFASGFLLLAACGGGSSGGGMSGGGPSGSAGSGTPASCTSGGCGASIITLTDSKGDFLSYIVNVTSLKLQTATGASVETVPVTTKIDFAKLANLKEVLSAGQIPAAEYVSATLTLDYTGADITADDGTGKAVPLNPLNANGTALTGPITVSTTLDSANHLVIASGRTGQLAFDFNLAASNTVNLPATTVTVSPTVVATVTPSDTGQVRVRGQLVNASATANDFVLAVLPFDDQVSTISQTPLGQATLGQVTVDVASTTTYQINGTAYAGMAGITALAALPANTLVAAFGSLPAGSQALTAQTVLAGTSLQDPTRNQISGTVIARSGNTLTLRGGTFAAPGGAPNYVHDDATVMVGANTAVTEEGTVGAFTTADISVGQHIDAFGTLSSTSATGGVTVDATAGEVQLDTTPVKGLVTSLAAGRVTMNLQSLDGLPVSAFNFAGTGTSTAQDATAGAYVINTGTLDQTGLVLNAPAQVSGIVVPFGMAPPDFTAQFLSAVPEVLVVDWAPPGTTMAFKGLTATSMALQFVLPGAGGAHSIEIGTEILDLATLAAVPTVAPDTTVTTDVFSIDHIKPDGTFSVENFNTFAAFVSALTTELTPTRIVNALHADGHFDSASNTFVATDIQVLITD